MKANLLKKNKNILRFPVISKVNSSKFQLFSISFKSKNFQTSQNPPPATYPTPPEVTKPSFSNHPTSPEVSKHRFETNNFYFGFKIVFWKQIKLTEVSLQRKETKHKGV